MWIIGNVWRNNWVTETNLTVRTITNFGESDQSTIDWAIWHFAVNVRKKIIVIFCPFFGNFDGNLLLITSCSQTRKVKQSRRLNYFLVRYWEWRFFRGGIIWTGFVNRTTSNHVMTHYYTNQFSYYYMLIIRGWINKCSINRKKILL